MAIQRAPAAVLDDGRPRHGRTPLSVPGPATSSHSPLPGGIPGEWVAVATGLTGTRHGATVKQQAALLEVLVILRPVALHHGMCRGADAQGGAIAGTLGIWRVGHPPLRTGCMGQCEVEERREPSEFLARDRNIVDETRLLLVIPAGFTPIYRGSGTWYTAGYAHKQARPMVIIYPDGTVLPQPAGATAWLGQQPAGW